MRARNLKPGFFKNDELAECSFAARILFAGLWCMADRRGLLEDRPKRIKAEVFPYDDVDIEALLGELEAHGFIRRYQVGTARGIAVVNFSRHQNPHKNERPSDLPEPPEVTSSTVPAPDEHRTCTVQAQGKHGASTVQAPGEHHSDRADSLIPDSLNPDSGSLIPESRSARASLRSALVDATASPGADVRVPPGEREAKPPPLRYLFDLWREHCPHLRQPDPKRGYTKRRKRLWAARCREPGFLESLPEAIRRIGQSRLCAGEGPSGWQASLDWFLRDPDAWVKAIEGQYDRLPGGGKVARDRDPTGLSRRRKPPTPQEELATARAWLAYHPDHARAEELRSALEAGEDQALRVWREIQQAATAGGTGVQA